ncbi:hypothetical protein [Bacillus sp. 179-C3.3 HS]|uniref:hypothetical protein n=1 Tax=Bacillus sp. 179-C3.3 HS TaxID=3232162 RepID=UPI00399F0F4B
MKVRPKHYPYPVITPCESEKNYRFSCNLELEEAVELDLMRFKVHYTLKNKTIQRLIDQGLAVFALHIECPSTMKRLLLTTNQKSEEFEVSIHDLNKTVDLNFFVLANENISDYENSELDLYSAGFEFELEKGDLLAIGQPETLEIEKEPLIEVNSIFELIPSMDKNAKPLTIDLSHTKIRIQLPKESFDQLSYLHGTTLAKTDAILAAIYYIPAMAEALYHIRAAYQSGDDTWIEEIRDTAWYKSIEARLHHNKMGIDALPEQNLIGVAHEMLDDPNKKAMNHLQELLEGGDSEE